MRIFDIAILVGISAFVIGLPAPVSAVYLVASIVTFSTYAYDKSAARNGRWRTQESTLHLLALIGGWPGGLLAQRVLHHKSKKSSFQALFWLSAVANSVLVAFLIHRFR